MRNSGKDGLNTFRLLGIKNDKDWIEANSDTIKNFLIEKDREIDEAMVHLIENAGEDAICILPQMLINFLIMIGFYLGLQEGEQKVKLQNIEKMLDE